jgi:ribosomal protein L10
MKQRIYDLSVSFLGFLAVLTVVCGCGKQGVSADKALVPGSVVTNPVVRGYWELKDTDVLVQVGRQALTKAALEASVQESMDLYEASSRGRSARAIPQMSNPEFQRQKLRAPLFSRYIVQTALAQEAVAQRVEPTEEDLKKADVTVNRLCKSMSMSRDDYAARLPGGKAELEQRMKDHANTMALKRKQFGDNAFAVSDEDAMRLREALKEVQAKALASNQVVRAAMESAKKILETCKNVAQATTSNAVAEIQAKLPEGVTFHGLVMARKDDLDGDEAAMELGRLMPGVWSSVVQMGERFELYYLHKVDLSQGADNVTYMFACATAPCAEEWPLPELSSIKGDIMRRKIREKNDPWIQEVLKKQGVLFPNGVAFMNFETSECKDRSHDHGPKKPRADKTEAAAHAEVKDDTP